MAQAEGWVIKAKLIRSKKFNALNGDDFTQKVYCLMLACKDSYGMMPADSFSLKGTLGPLDKTKNPNAYRKAVDKLAAVGLVYEWEHQGDPWLYMMGHDQENRTDRRANNPIIPRPDIEAMWVKTNEVWSKSGVSPELVRSNSNSSQEFVSHPPDPDPIPDPIPDPPAHTSADRFEIFWKTYPKKKGKDTARRAWGKLEMTDEFFQQILDAVEKHKKSNDWIKEGGQYIPYPATWLNGGHWSDSVEIETAKNRPEDEPFA